MRFIIIYLLSFFLLTHSIGFFNYIRSPKNIIISHKIFNSINYNVFSHFIKEQLLSPTIVKETIYIPIIIIYGLNLYMNYKLKERNNKLNKIDYENANRIRRLINQIILVFEFIFIKDIESVT